VKQRPPTLTLPRKGGGDSVRSAPSPLTGEGSLSSPSPLTGEGSLSSPSPLTGEGRGGGGARTYQISMGA
jgi:hypothetical protein